MTTAFEELVASAASGTARGLSRETCLEATREFVARRRAEILARHNEGESGSNVMRMLSETADTVVHGVYQFALAMLDVPKSVSSRLCLCALGGYGREELCPGSDLDVCLLYEGRLSSQVKQLNNLLVPFLWDIGFVVGYSIRSVKDARELAREDMQAFTSLLESRLVYGDSRVFARMKLAVRELRTGAFGERFIGERIRDRFERLPESQADIFSPQPNIKENAGGLRDFHVALWLLMVSFNIERLDEATAQGVITPEEQLELADALDFVFRIRCELHFHSGTADDLLSYKNQKHLAKAFGYESEHQSSVLQLMQEYYAAASTLRRFLRVVANLCNFPTPEGVPESIAEAPRGYFVQDGQLFVGIDDPNWFAHTPSRLMEVFWHCARHGAELSRYSERLLADSLGLVNDTFRSNDMVCRFFIAICNHPLQAGRVLRQMAACGLLGRYLPEFAEIEGSLVYEDFHHYPVDEHTLQAVESLGRLPEMDDTTGRCLHEALENLTDPYILVLAILFHDLGKAEGEVHVAEGVRRARAICERLGLAEDDAERIAFLVEHHMLMNTISQYRDIDDEEMLQSFADTVMTEQRLRALFLLSYADLSAVGPNVWTDWKGALLLQLYLRTVKRQLGRVETIGDAYWESAKAGEIRAAAPRKLREEVEPHLRGLGQRYFLAMSPEHVALHLECIEEARERGLATRLQEGAAAGHSNVVVVTRDRQGLFAQLAGTFSSQLIDVKGAVLFTRPDGFVVDVFTVSDARQARPLTQAQLGAVEGVLEEVLLEGTDVQEHVERARRRLFALLQPRIPVQTRIEFDNHSSRTHTVVDVETGDRTGLLYDIARAMARAGLDIATARIVTDARRVRDSFYVQLSGNRIEDSRAQEMVRDAIHQAIHPRAAVEAKGG